MPSNDGVRNTFRISHYIILSQDPSGIFFTVDIENRPLISQLNELLQNGLGTTQNLTHLKVVERLNASQHPALFSIINTFHFAYNDAVSNDSRLSHILPLCTLPQTYCYRFTATLGQTKHTMIVKTEGIVYQTRLFSLENNDNSEVSSALKLVSLILLY